MDIYIRSQSQLTGVTGNWFLTQGVWLKQMASLKLRNGHIEKLFKPIN
ncbi:MAG: hypothetical protein HOM21_05990 [Halobacteriovoraceae bacterium]|nr:hypothetical protein [Halobacteriovoraceae bacterium]